MEPTNPATPLRPSLHPLVATAAVSVILLSIVGVALLVMNRSNATPSPDGAPVAEAQSRNTPARTARATPSVEPRAPARPSTEPPRQVTQASTVCTTCGVVDSLRDIKVKGQGSGVGGVGGAVVGGLLGNQIGAGNGKAIATVAGAVGGAFAGNAIEKSVRATVDHEMVVRLDDGTTRTFTQVEPFPYTVGERVRVVNGAVRRG